MAAIHHDGTIAALGVGHCHAALQEVHARQPHLLEGEGGDGLSQTNGLLLVEIGRLDEEQSIFARLFVHSMVFLLQLPQLSQQLAQQPQVRLLGHPHTLQPDLPLVLPLLLEDLVGPHVAAPDVDAAREDALVPVAAEHVLLLADALVCLQVEGLGGYARPALPDEPCPRSPSSNLHCHSNHYYYKHPQDKQTFKYYPQMTIYGTPILSLLGCPFVKPVSRAHLDSGHLGALAATPEDVHALPLGLPSLLADELVVGSQVGGELLLAQDVFVCDVELLQELGERSLQPLVLIVGQREQPDQYTLRTHLPLALCLQLSQPIKFGLEFEEELIEGETVVSVELQVNEVQVQDIQKLCLFSAILLALLLLEYGSLLLLQFFIIPMQSADQWNYFLEYIDKAVDDGAYLAIIADQFLIYIHQQSPQGLPLLNAIDGGSTGERLIIEALPKDGQRLHYFRRSLVPLDVLDQLRQDLLVGEGDRLLLHFLLNWLGCSLGGWPRAADGLIEQFFAGSAGLIQSDHLLVVIVVVLLGRQPFSHLQQTNYNYHAIARVKNNSRPIQIPGLSLIQQSRFPCRACPSNQLLQSTWIG